ncbi:MAG TPA: amidohydrolase family protein, partial [Candidatus Cloacimonadota bacterium]|nr:amidohydrolase family protein [Candidatus Cloacimonadota bacterium]
MRKIRTNLINPVSADQTELFKDYIISIEDTVITEISPFKPDITEPYEDRRNEVAIPGLIDIHVHLSQYRMRGSYRPALLPWLEECVFPEEERSSQRQYAYSVSKDFYPALFRAGTTSAVIYTAPYREACEAAFEIAEDLGARAWIGMTLMDRNSPEGLQQTTDYAVEHSMELYWKYHDKTPLLDYIFTPRFAPTCSEELMRRISDFAIENQAWIQTHLSENRDEIRWVKELFGYHSYTELYQAMGLLTDHTIMAHCIHLSDKEINILRDSGASIAHCPDSNFYLKSGEIDLPGLISQDVKLALGSDVGAGTSLSMLYHAKLMNY